MCEDDYLPMPAMTKEQSIAISNRTIDAYINFDLKRMQKCMEGQRFTMPDGLTSEQFRQCMKDRADEINA